MIGEYAVNVSFLLVLSVLTSAAQSWQRGQSGLIGWRQLPACQALGQISLLNQTARMLRLKSDSGELTNYRYDESTRFFRADGIAQPGTGDASILPNLLEPGDRLCVETLQEHSEGLAARVLVTYRPDIASSNNLELIVWQAKGVFGTVRAIDQSKRITISVARSSGPTEVTIDGAGTIPLRAIAPVRDDPIVVEQSTWDSLAVGDPVYVRTEDGPNTHVLKANLLVSGGLRSFIGAIRSINSSQDLVALVDFETRKTRLIHLNSSHLYVAGAAGSVGTPKGMCLYRAWPSDLKEGDSVLIFGRENAQAGSVEGHALITWFSSGSLLGSGAAQTVNWIFNAIGQGPGWP